MKIVEAAVQSAKVMVKRTVENIGVEIPAQTGPISKVRGKGTILPRPQRAETLRVFGSGPRRAMMRLAFNHPEKVVNALNPKEKELQALQDPSAAEAGFHDQFARKLADNWEPGDDVDDSIPWEERVRGFVPYQPDDPRIADFEAKYGIEVKPKNLVQDGRPVSVFDYVRPNGRVSGAALVPVEEAWRTVLVPDIARAIGEKNAEQVIALLELVDTTRPEAISGRQAAVRKEVIEAAGKRAMGLTPELVTFTAQAFLSAAENPELPAKQVVSALLKPKK